MQLVEYAKYFVLGFYVFYQYKILVSDKRREFDYEKKSIITNPYRIHGSNLSSYDYRLQQRTGEHEK